MTKSTCTAARVPSAIRLARPARAFSQPWSARCASTARNAASRPCASAAAKPPPWRSNSIDSPSHGMILTQEQEMIRDAVRDFARNRLAPFAGEWDRNGHFPKEALAGLAELGVFGVVVPEQWGGAGLNTLSLALAIEEIAAG